MTRGSKRHTSNSFLFDKTELNIEEQCTNMVEFLYRIFIHLLQDMRLLQQAWKELIDTIEHGNEASSVPQKEDLFHWNSSLYNLKTTQIFLEKYNLLFTKRISKFVNLLQLLDWPKSSATLAKKLTLLRKFFLK